MVVYKYLDEIAQAIMFIMGGVHKNPGPVTRDNDQLKIKSQNVRGRVEVKKKKLIINKCNEMFKENPSTIIRVLRFFPTKPPLGGGMPPLIWQR